MPENEGCNSSSFSELDSLEALSSEQRTGSAAGDQEEVGDDRSVHIDTIPPPLGVKLTGHRLLKMMAAFSFGITKGILTYVGQSTSLTTLDWVAGALLAVMVGQCQGYTGSGCLKRKAQSNGNGSSKMIWLPRSVIA
ncbi:hypothetical protein EI94DRAFT_242707 [Lactarius quietus]|nr:hypothetical protein EI94DRAFT_242707 [Lactarius quietus]